MKQLPTFVRGYNNLETSLSPAYRAPILKTGPVRSQKPED